MVGKGKTKSKTKPQRPSGMWAKLRAGLFSPRQLRRGGTR